MKCRRDTFYVCFCHILWWWERNRSWVNISAIDDIICSLALIWFVLCTFFSRLELVDFDAAQVMVEDMRWFFSFFLVAVVAVVVGWLDLLGRFCNLRFQMVSMAFYYDTVLHDLIVDVVDMINLWLFACAIATFDGWLLQINIMWLLLLSLSFLFLFCFLYL